MPDRRIAAFDFDGTLTRRDTMVPFLAYVHGRRKLATALADVGPAALSARARRPPGGPHHRDLTKERLLARLFAGDSAERVADAGRSFADRLPGRLHPRGRERLAWHRDQGHELVIVSASLLPYLEPFGDAHGIHHVIGTGLEDDGAGRLTGRIVGPNVRGPEKAVRLEAWLAGERPLQLYAYGNSSGDTELLALATDPVWLAGRNARRPRPH